MLSFTSGLDPGSGAFAIFVTEKYEYKDKKNILSNDAVKKINSFLSVLKEKKGQDFEPFTGEISQPYDIYKVNDDIAYIKIIKYGILTDYVFYNRNSSIIEPVNEETTLEKKKIGFTTYIFTM